MHQVRLQRLWFLLRWLQEARPVWCRELSSPVEHSRRFWRTSRMWYIVFQSCSLWMRNMRIMLSRHSTMIYHLKNLWIITDCLRQVSCICIILLRSSEDLSQVWQQVSCSYLRVYPVQVRRVFHIRSAVI